MISSPESPVPSPDSILPLFVTAQSNLLSIALACDDALPTRLEANAVAAASRVASAVLSLGVAVEQCIPIFTSSARQRMRVADKRLGMKEDELADSVKFLQSSLQHLSVDRCVVEDVEDTMHCINDVFMGTGTLSPTSVLLSPARLGLMRCVDEAFHLQAAIDTDNSRVSHAPWFTRGEVNSVSITLVDTAGDSVHGVTADDVVCTFEGDDMVGWSTVPTVLVDTDTVLLTVALSLDCSNSASLHAHICGAYFIVLLTATASPSVIANAIAECARLRRVMSDATPEDVASLLTACTAGMSSRAVAQDFIETVTFISARRSVCSMMCGEAGVIPTILTALSAHGAVRPEMRALAAKGCGALGCMTVRHPPNADKIVSAGGLDVLYELMAAHADDQTVQKPACATLGSMVAAVSPASLAVIRAGRAVELLRAAKVRFPAEGSGTVSSWANRALDRLV